MEHSQCDGGHDDSALGGSDGSTLVWVAQAAHYGPEAYVLAWPSAESGPLPVEGALPSPSVGNEARDPDAKRREPEEMLAAKQSPFPR